MKKIALLIPSLQAGGMERVMAELSRYFASKPDTDIHLVIYGKSREIFYPVPENITVHKPSFEFSNRLRFYFTIRTMLYLRRTVTAIAPDSVLSFGEYWNSFVLLSLLGLKVPVYVSDRSQPDKSLGLLQDYLRRMLYPGAKGVIAQTLRAKEIYYANYRHENITVIGNPIRFIENGELTDTKRENIVLMVGRLINTKHQDRLVRIFLEIGKPGWKLVLVGYDHLKQVNSKKLEQLIKNAGAEDRIILKGKRDDVDQFYLRSKVFAFTSSSEGFPNAIGEALSAGLPVIAYDCTAGPSEMIADGENGFLVPVFEDEIFKEKLVELMEDDKKRAIMGKKAKNTIRAFERDVIAEQFWNFVTKG